MSAGPLASRKGLNGPRLVVLGFILGAVLTVAARIAGEMSAPFPVMPGEPLLIAEDLQGSTFWSSAEVTRTVILRTTSEASVRFSDLYASCRG